MEGQLYFNICQAKSNDAKWLEIDLGRTVSNLPFIEATTKIAGASRMKELSVDCFKTEKGIFIIEMNCRISGHYPLHKD